MAPSRLYGLDWLRVLAFALLIPYHTGMLFVGWDFHLMNEQTLTALQRPMIFSHHWRLALLFAVSGAGTWFALRRKSRRAYLADRCKRLLVPLVFAMLVIVPPQIYVEHLANGQTYASYWAFQKTVFAMEPYPKGSFSWHHLWFVAYLFTFTLVLLPLLAWLRQGRVLPRCQAWLADHPVLVFCLGLGNLLLNLALKPYWPEVTHALLDDWATFARYIYLFFAGFCVIGDARLRNVLQQHAWRALAAALTLYGLVWLTWPTIYSWPGALTTGYAIIDLFTWLIICALFGLSLRYLDRPHPWLTYANEAVYPYYILHQTLLLVAAYWVIQQPWHAWFKFGLLNLTTLIGCALLYDGLIRRFWLTRFLFGMKPQSKRRDPEQNIAALDRPTAMTPPNAL